MKTPLPLVALLSAFSASALADDKDAQPTVKLDNGTLVTLDGQLRTRVLVSTGLDHVAGGTDETTSMVRNRARLGASFTKGANRPSITVRLQDVRSFGEEADTLSDYSADGLDAHEAYARVPFTKNFDMVLGRQEIDLDAQRLVGSVGWSDQGRSFDGLRFDLVDDTRHLSVFSTVTSSLDSTGAVRAHDNLFSGAHAQFKVGEGKLSVMDLVNSNEGVILNTGGVFYDGGSGPLKLGAEAYLQNNLDAGTMGWMGAGKLGYAIDGASKPQITVWGEALSGADGDTHAFSTLYATNHKFYGEMDYFLNVPVHAAGLGLLDAGGRIQLKPHESVAMNLDAHHLMAMVADGAGEKTFGDEIDLKATCTAVPGVSFQTLYGVMLPGEAMRTLRGIGANQDMEAEHFFYLTTDLSF